jgi:hypothetical protein
MSSIYTNLSHGAQRPVRIVLHSTEGDAPPGNYGAGWEKTADKLGAQIVVGRDGSIARYVPDTQIAYGTGGNNTGTLDIEIVGHARQSDDEWRQNPQQLQTVAAVIAGWSKAYGIPIEIDTTTRSGVSTHAMNSALYPASEKHWDPGPGFPLGLVIAQARVYADQGKGLVPAQTVGQVTPPVKEIPNYQPDNAPTTTEIPNATPGAASGAVDPIAAVLTQAGFSGEGLRTAYAIVKRESGGDPTQLNNNPSTGDLSYGLFQINMLGGMGPSRRAQFGLKSNVALFDPLTNARAAFQMSKGGTDFGAWGLGPNAYRHVPLDMSVVPANLATGGGTTTAPTSSGGTTFVSGAAGPPASSTPGPPPPTQPIYVPPTPPALSPLPATPAAATPVITVAPLPADKPAPATPAPPALRPGTPTLYDPSQDPALQPAQGGPILRLYPVSKLGAAPAPGGQGGPLRRLFPVSKLPGVAR